MSEAPKTLTVPEAAQATGLTEKAIRRRIERGAILSTVGHDRRRRVLVSSLREAGLVGTVGETTGHVPQVGTPDGETISALLARYEEAVMEVGRLRALTDGHERRERELTEQLHQAAARITELEAKTAASPRRRFFRRAKQPATA